jgi:hypothetical protein
MHLYDDEYNPLEGDEEEWCIIVKVANKI